MSVWIQPSINRPTRFLEYTRQISTLDRASGLDDPGKCTVAISSIMATSSSLPFPSAPPAVTTSPSDARSPPPDKDFAGHRIDNTTAIVGGTLGGSFVLVLFIAGIFYFLQKRPHATETTLHPYLPAYESNNARTGVAGARVSFVSFREGAVPSGLSTGPPPELREPELRPSVLLPSQPPESEHQTMKLPCYYATCGRPTVQDV